MGVPGNGFCWQKWLNQPEFIIWRTKPRMNLLDPSYEKMHFLFSDSYISYV